MHEVAWQLNKMVELIKFTDTVWFYELKCNENRSTKNKW